jgi:hypothetical protein
MGFRCGIVGLPNVGKSTLFNALTETAAAQAANYPFCTIEPNVGRVAVPDPRLAGDRRRSPKAPASSKPQLEFVDIAGLVRGRLDRRGLGNQFLGNIREVDAIVPCAALFSRKATSPMSRAGRPDLPMRRRSRPSSCSADLESLEKRVPEPRQEGAAGRQGGQDAGIGASVRRWSFCAIPSLRG